MELSPEDALRLNVLLANDPLAIRINESTMTLYGLLPDGEVRVQLNPSGPDEKYLKLVRAMLSEKALGSPGGYPLYLQRWTRMGQMREESLEQLLMLGDPTAVFAVVCAQGLTDELARRAWWASEEAENARRMLQTEEVVQGATGRVLARYLVDYLPFETETETMIESVRAVLQPGLLDEEERLGLWKKAARKTPYLVGFVAACPDDLPEPLPPHGELAVVAPVLEGRAAAGDGAARLLLRTFSGPGQRFLDTCRRILARPPTLDVVTGALDAMRGYFAGLRPEGDPDLTIAELIGEAEQWLDHDPAAGGLLQALPGLRQELEAMRVLSGAGYGVVRPAMKGSNAIGSLMRRKLEPVTGPLTDRIEILMGAASDRSSQSPP